MIEVIRGVGMGVGIGGAGNRGDGVASGGGGVGVTGGGAGWKARCRFPYDIFGELREDLPYRLPFAFNIGDVFL